MQSQYYLEWAQPFYADVLGSAVDLECSIFHLWHGAISNRAAQHRHQKLVPYRFDPQSDLAKTQGGVWCWASAKSDMHRHVREYFAHRKEDG